MRGPSIFFAHSEDTERIQNIFKDDDGVKIFTHDFVPRGQVYVAFDPTEWGVKCKEHKDA